MLCRRVVVMVAIVIGGLLFPPARVEATGTISGRIVDKTTGAGVYQAEIYVANTGQVTYTSGGGYYSIAVTGYTSVHLLVTHSNYAKAHDYSVSVPGTRDFELTTDQGEINVTIRDQQTGNVVTGIEVLLMTDSTEGTGFNSTSTTIGYGVLDKLAPMTYYVHAFPQGGGYYDTRISGVTITGDGDVQDVTIYLTDEGGTLYAQVVDEAESPVVGASVYVNGSAGSGGGSSTCSDTTDSTGHFRCGLSGGYYDVHISQVIGYPNFVDYEVLVTNGQTTSPVFHLFEGNVTLHGQVINKAGDPLPGVTVDPFPWFDPGTWGRQATDSEGRVSFSLLKSGQYQIFVHAAGYQDVDVVTNLVDGSNEVNFELVRDTALLVVSPPSLFLLGEYDGSVLTCSFSTLNGGASGPLTWTTSSSAIPSQLITVTTPSGSEGDEITVEVDPCGLTVGSTYTGTLTVVGSGDSGTRQVPIEVLVVEDIFKTFLPMVMK